MKALTENEVIDQIKEKLKGYNLTFVRFKNKFTSLKDLTRSKNMVILKCPIHGEVECYYRSIGKIETLCPECRREIEREISKQKFIQSARKIHNDWYDYSKVDYISSSDKVCIICPTHGEFWQTPNSHLCGSGCPNCTQRNGVRKERTKYLDKQSTLEQIKTKCSSRSKNGIFQEFVKFIDEDNWREGATRMILRCPIHGEYEVSVRDYLEFRSYGCERCGHRRTDDKVIESFLSLIDACNKLYGENHLDFSKAKYKDENTKLEVICHEKFEDGTEHGSFFIKPKILRKGSGCPFCNKNHHRSRGEQRVLNFLQSSGLKFTAQFPVDLGIRVKNTSKVFIDFQVILDNRTIWIEYNGEQHYYYSNRFFPEYQEYEDQLFRDEMVKEYAKDHNIDLLVISHKDLSEIEEVLEAYFIFNRDITKLAIPKHYG